MVSLSVELRGGPVAVCLCLPLKPEISKALIVLSIDFQEVPLTLDSEATFSADLVATYISAASVCLCIKTNYV